jgi:hypothetical protein
MCLVCGYVLTGFGGATAFELMSGNNSSLFVHSIEMEKLHGLVTHSDGHTPGTQTLLRMNKRFETVVCTVVFVTG